MNAATLKKLSQSLSQSLTFASFVSFAVQSYQVLEHFISLDKNKFTQLGCSRCTPDSCNIVNSQKADFHEILASSLIVNDK